MLRVDILKDEILQENVEKFISALLPQENYDPACFSANLALLQKYIRLDEFSMEYYVLIKALCELDKIVTVSQNYMPKLDRNTFEEIISASLADSIASPTIRVSEWLEHEGLRSDLQIPAVRLDACQKLYARCMELYDRCFDLAELSTNVPNNMPALKSAFIGHIATETINAQVKIINGSLRVGRKVYTGFEDWLTFVTDTGAELTARVSDIEEGEDEVVTLDTVQKAQVLMQSMGRTFESLGSYDIPELDDYTPMLRHRLAVVVGMENIGKTKFGVDKATTILLNGHKVVYMCGETQAGDLLAQILVTYVYKKFGLCVRPEYIYDSSECREDVQKAIKVATAEVIESGLLTLVGSLSYVNLYNQLIALYKETEFDALFIDHSYALRDKDKLDNPIESMAYSLRMFKRKFPVYILVLSHPSSSAKPLLATGRAVTISPTRGSAVLGEEADETFILRENDAQRKAGVLSLEVYKRRRAAKPEPIVLRKRFSVNTFEYDKSLQADSDNLISTSAQAIIDSIEQSYEDDASMYTL